MASTFVAAFEILSFGAIIVLVVLGLGIIASMMGIFNFAQGEFVLLGAYITYLAFSRGIPIWAGMVAAPFIVGGLGFVLEALIIRRFYAAPIVAMLGTYALGLIIRESVRGLIGGFYLTVPEPTASREDYVARALEMISNTAPFDITHHPAMSLPCGMVDGLPVGLMLVGRMFEESTIYRAAHAFEQVGDWKKM